MIVVAEDHEDIRFVHQRALERAGHEHQWQAGTSREPASPSGPEQCGQRAGVRQSAHTSAGAYPGRATCTSTGPLRSASRAAANAAEGTRAPRDSPSFVALRTTRGEARRAGETSRTQPRATRRSTSDVRV